MKPNCKTNSTFLKLFFLIIGLGSFSGLYAQKSSWEFPSLAKISTKASFVEINSDNDAGESGFSMNVGANKSAKMSLFSNGDFKIKGPQIILESPAVGIGTSSPSHKLHVDGRVRASDALMGSKDGDYAFFGNANLNQDPASFTNYALMQGKFGGTFLNAPLNAGLYFRINNEDKVLIEKDGIVFRDNIMVNTQASPNRFLNPTVIGGTNHIKGTALTVDGRVYISDEGGTEKGFINRETDRFKNYLLWVEEGIVAKDFAVGMTSQWPDFVFNKDYKLNSLKEVDTFIKANGHLPTMPSATEVEKDGFTVSDITKRTVKTIEELTLHAIEQQKLIENQTQLIESLMKRLTALENK